DFPRGGKVTLTAEPAAGYTLQTWQGAGCADTPTCTVTMSRAVAVTVIFAREAPNQYTLTTATAGHATGTITPDCSGGCGESPGAVVTLNASAPVGAHFDHWSGCPNPSGSVCTVTMDGDRQVTA